MAGSFNSGTMRPRSENVARLAAGSQGRIEHLHGSVL